MAAPVGNNLLPIIQGGRAVGYSPTGQAPGASTTGNSFAAPGSATSNYTSYNQNGSTTKYVNGVPTTTPAPSGTLNAVVANPGNQTAPPPSVITSDTAGQDLANKQNQISQLNQDTQQHQQAMAQPQAQPLASDTNDGNQSSSTQQPQGSQSSQGTPSLDDQIQSIIGSLGSKTQGINDSAQAQETAISAAQTDEQNQQDAAYQATMAKLTAITQGTYPLSPAESALVSSTASVFQNTINAQQTANQAYTGQMTELMATLGINTSAPTQAIGQIQATIDSGNQKITAINAQMSQSLATLQEGFQKQDFDQVQQAWSDAADQFSQRNNELQTMLSSVQANAKQQQDELQAQTTTGLSALMDMNTVSYQDKQLAISQATLDEKTKDDMQKNLIAMYTAGMTNADGSPATGGNSLPAVDVGPTGAPNPVAQAQFLAQFPPQVSSLIKGVADYNINPSSISTSKKQAMGGFTQSQILALASQYNPNFDEKSYATRAAMQKNITSGAYSQTITAANTLIQHLQKLQADYSKLGNTGVLGNVLNPVKNTEMNLMGSGATTAVDTDIAAVASEAAKIYKGTGSATDQEITDWQKSISPNATPDQMKAAITSITDLMGGKLSTLSDNYQSVMGQPGSFQILTDQNAKALQSLGIDPSTVDPTYGNSPTLKLQTFAGASSDNAALLQQLSQVMPNATPDEIVQTLQANGQLQ